MNVDELRRQAKNLDERYPLPDGAARFSWGERRKELRRKMINDKRPDRFLQWSVSSEFLSTGLVPHILAELDDLMDTLDSKRWERVLKAPDFGGAVIDEKYGTTGTMIQQAYHLSLWEGLAYSDVRNLGNIVEFGGGYGAMAYLCRQLGFKGDYTIIDLPEMCLLQQYYLENVGIFDVESVSSFEGVDVDLYIGLFSLSEVSPDERKLISSGSYLFGYQPNWGEFDNRKWFGDVANSLKWMDWTDFVNPHFSNHRVCIGI